MDVVFVIVLIWFDRGRLGDGWQGRIARRQGRETASGFVYVPFGRVVIALGLFLGRGAWINPRVDFVLWAGGLLVGSRPLETRQEPKLGDGWWCR